MTTNLASCLAFTLSYEGGFVDDARDPGGATNLGITLATFRAVMRNARLGVLQLRRLTRAQAETIYRTRYYLPARCDQLPPGIDLMVGDMAVNAGVREASMLLQRALGVTVDGVIGPETVAHAQQAAPRTIISALSRSEVGFYRRLVNFAIYGSGWVSRVEARTTTALNMASA